MNLGGQGAKSMSMSSSSVSWKSGDGVSDQFPVGLRVLVVDDDPTCLMILEKMLRHCLYEVTKCNRAEIALSLLRENKNGFDIVISEVHMPDMDGFKLLEHIRLKMKLPVIMMSADASERVVMKGVTHGADDYLIKPVRIESLKNIWQHVVRKRKYERKDFEQSGSMEEGEQQQKPSEDADLSSSANEGNWRNSKRRKDEEDEMRLCIDGLLRRGESCIHPWMNDIRLDIKRGNFSKEEEETTIKLYEMLGNRWSAIAAFLPGRTDNEIEYVWNTHLKKRLKHDQTMSIAKGESVTVSQGDSNASSESVAMNLSFSTQTGSESRVSPQDSSSDFSSCWNYL